MSKTNIDEISAMDVVCDITARFDGHVIDGYFGDKTPISYEVLTLSDRKDRVEVVAEDAEGNKRTFILSVREA